MSSLEFFDINKNSNGIFINTQKNMINVKNNIIVFKNFDPKNTIKAPKTSLKMPIYLKDWLIACSKYDKPNPQPCSPVYSAEI